MREGLIRAYEEMDKQRVNEEDDDCYLFCKTHIDVGIDTLKAQGVQGLKPAIDTEVRKKLSMMTNGESVSYTSKKRNLKKKKGSDDDEFEVREDKQ